MVDIQLDFPGSPPMREVHIWIGHYADGTEGMLAADLPLPGMDVTRHMPLMSSRRETAENMRSLAEHIRSLSKHGHAEMVRIELRTFQAITS